MQIILYIVLAFFCTMGILEAVRFISLHMYTPKHKPNHLILYPAKGTVEEMELLLRSLHHQAQWDCYSGDTVLLLDLGLDDEGTRIAKILAQDLDGLLYCTPETLLEQIKKEII